MATIGQHVAAFFDPTVAVNKDGYLVEANGFFDNGSFSDDFLSQEDLSVARQTFYEPFEGTTGFYNVSSSDNVSDVKDINDGLDYITDQIQDAAVQQWEASQASADRAMEFSASEAEIARRFNADQAALNRKFQAEQAQKAMDYQTMMSNTAYQRAMADMEAAGLNPKLVAKLGAASTPSGVSASGSTASSSAASGVSASMTQANVSAIASVLSSYITGADALDRNENDFVKSILTALIQLAV